MTGIRGRKGSKVHQRNENRMKRGKAFMEKFLECCYDMQADEQDKTDNIAEIAIIEEAAN